MKLSTLINMLQDSLEIRGDIEVHLDLDVGDDVVPIKRAVYNETSETGLPPGILILQG